MNDVTHPLPRDVYWQQHVEAWKHSGLSQAEFCTANELPYHRFIYWRGKSEGISREPQAKHDAGGFATVSVRHDSDRGLTLALPNGFVMRGICSENLSVVRQLLEQL